ncbi:alpha-ribazole phosphatase [Halobacteroides halobius DSM 5150]|uniref:Alpha-ribazole phosphatase n=1 Tax=Halobacteroides halobius (strain ATCC 35273 / DSM 5150 / MD-1) TaxID=748449 RepID=L0KC12_HALHC|nr:alpha-ribazole phosphatase [Halobacteroides halobius]AGB41628.1 alpha-ribazole phosphatase [Halobacteroides halobius DSM 5150]
MGTEIVLVRHGETDWNQAGRFQGSEDIPLNDKGKSQAKKLAQRLKNKQFDAIYASDLSRAFKTAEIIADNHNLVIKERKALQEINFGEWEGLTFADLQAEYQSEFEAWEQDPVTNGAPSGENLAKFQTRVVASLKKILIDDTSKRVLVVTHGGVVRVLVATFLGMPLAKCWRLSQSNTAVSQLNFYDDEVILELFNSTVHLE